MKKSLSDKFSYKFINFKKAANETAAGKINLDESISQSLSAEEFYLNLIKESEDKKEEKIETKFDKKNKKTLSETKTKNINKFDKHSYLKAAQTNDLNYIKQYLDHNLALNECDDYKWNVLMIAIVSLNNQVVKYLFETQSNKPDFAELINARDVSDNSPESLAVRFKNKIALELIENFKKNNVKCVNSKSLVETKESDNFYCNVCKKQCDSYFDHIKSISHQLNENEKESIDLRPNYFLRPSNKGYQLLIKSGWNELSGLGANEQGDTRPIRTRAKLDRLGIGISDDDKDAKTVSTRTRKVFDLKKDNEKRGKERIEDAFKRQKLSLKSKKSFFKTKNFDRNFRYYFNN